MISENLTFVKGILEAYFAFVEGALFLVQVFVALMKTGKVYFPVFENRSCHSLWQAFLL